MCKLEEEINPSHVSAFLFFKIRFLKCLLGPAHKIVSALPEYSQVIKSKSELASASLLKKSFSAELHPGSNLLTALQNNLNIRFNLTQ